MDCPNQSWTPRDSKQLSAIKTALLSSGIRVGWSNSPRIPLDNKQLAVMTAAAPFCNVVFLRKRQKENVGKLPKGLSQGMYWQDGCKLVFSIDFLREATEKMV